MCDAGERLCTTRYVTWAGEWNQSTNTKIEIYSKQNNIQRQTLFAAAEWDVVNGTRTDKVETFDYKLEPRRQTLSFAVSRFRFV